MAGLLVDVQLEILVVVHETPTDLVDGQMKWILKEKIMEGDFSRFVKGFCHLLVDQVGVITMRERCLHLDHLTSHLSNRWSGNKVKTARYVVGIHLFPDGVDVRILPLSSSLP